MIIHPEVYAFSVRNAINIMMGQPLQRSLQLLEHWPGRGMDSVSLLAITIELTVD